VIWHVSALQEISSLLWQRASPARFASSLGAAYVLSRRIDDKPLYSWISECLRTHEIQFRHSKTKMDILGAFDDPIGCTKIDHLGLLFSGVVYPIVCLIGASAKEPGDVGATELGWLNTLFQSLAVQLFRAGDRELSRASKGEGDVFGNDVMCGFIVRSCTFKCRGEGAVLPCVRKVSERDLSAALPAELRAHGLAKYWGGRGVRSTALIPAVRGDSPVAFLSSAVLRMGTAFYAETVRYGVPDKQEHISTDIGLGPVVVEGVCARAKRACKGAGHGRTRDELLRSLVCATERWWDLSADDTIEKVVSEFRKRDCEKAKDRKRRLGDAALERLNVMRAQDQERACKRQRRQKVTADTPRLFSFHRLWKQQCLVQAQKRGNTSLTRYATEAIRDWLVAYDTKEMPLEVLREEAARRGKGALEDRKALLRFLRLHDKKTEDIRSKEEKEERKRQRKEEVDESEEEEQEEDEVE